MRALIAIAVTLASLYGGYWFVGSAQVERAATAALDDLRTQGWKVDYADLSTTGFPSRFDTTVTDLALASPDGAVAWEAPFFQVFALSYRPNRIIAIAPPEQRLTIAGQTLDLASERLRASAAFGLSGALPFDQAILEGGITTLASDRGWSLALDRVLAAIRPAGSGLPRAYDLYLEANNLRAPAGSDLQAQLTLDATLTLDRPLDREAQGARLLALTLRSLRLSEGDAALTASGDLAPDAEGFLSGTLTLRTPDWRAVLDRLQDAGLLLYDQAPVLAGALEELAGDKPDLELPLTFRDGGVEALGLVLLPAPRV